MRTVAPPLQVLRAGFRTLERAALGELGREGLRRFVFERTLDVRYAGQSYEIALPFAPGWTRGFHRRHLRLFGHAAPDRAVEVVTLRLRARGGRARLPADPLPRGGRGAPVGTRPVFFDGLARRVPVYRRDDLPPRRHGRGPAIICEYSATTVVPPRWRFGIEPEGGLMLEAGA